MSLSELLNAISGVVWGPGMIGLLALAGLRASKTRGYLRRLDAG
ncbi:MAG TPA: hypothetical protein VMZ31_20445 [Phycisphaerae bacterium]|nr:hypothetical protein [Phycisphaerae bacterium]